MQHGAWQENSWKEYGIGATFHRHFVKRYGRDVGEGAYSVRVKACLSMTILSRYREAGQPPMRTFKCYAEVAIDISRITSKQYGLQIIKP